jgi:hypothetical protein
MKRAHESRRRKAAKASTRVRALPTLASARRERIREEDRLRREFWTRIRSALEPMRSA